MAIQGVIFDLGHTLMQLHSSWSEVFERGVVDLAAYVDAQGLGLDGLAFARALLERRLENYEQAKATRREVTAEASMRWTLAQWGVADADPVLVRGAINAFFAYEDRQWLAYPEAIPVLRALAERGLRLGMFSNATDDAFIQQLVDRLGFRPWLDPALTSAGTGFRKPDPAAFTPIVDAWHLAPGSIAVVGDRPEADILGAQLVGMRGIWIPARRDARQETGADVPDAAPVPGIVPDATLERLDDLPPFLEGCGW